MSRHSRQNIISLPFFAMRGSWLVSLPFALRHELLWSRQFVAAQDDRVVVEPKTGSAPPEQQAGGGPSEKLVLVDAGAEAKKRAELSVVDLSTKITFTAATRSICKCNSQRPRIK